MSTDRLRRIMIVTGSRAEYDIVFAIAASLIDRQDIELGFVVTGSHLSPYHGLTGREIHADGIPVWAEVPSLLATDGLGTRPRALSLLIGHLVTILEQRRPDLVLACGDREDVLATAITCAYMNTPFCHYAAGDEAFDGNVDNSVRHAASKLAHLLLVTHPAHRQLLEASGENPDRIHVVGNSGLDRIAATPHWSEQILRTHLPYALPATPRALVIHHPTTRTVTTAGEEMRAILVGLDQAGAHPIVSYPNHDAGNAEIRRVIDPSQIPCEHHNLDRETFVNLVRHCQLIIGNSSMSILEAPSYGVPSVIVGIRQKNRLAGPHVLRCAPDAEQITNAVRTVCAPDFRDALPTTNPYGDGESGPRIAQLLASVDLTDRLTHKQFECLKGAFGRE